MSIILNECKFAEKALKDCELGAKPSETIVRVAKYYMHTGNSKAKTRDLLDEFVLRCGTNTPLTKWSDLLDYAVKQASKYPPIMLDSVPITKGEMERIDALGGAQIRRLAFTLLCIVKFKHMAFGNEGYWVTTPDNEVMKMANIATSIRRQSSMFGQLRDEGLIRFSKKIDNLDVQVLFVETEGDVVMEVTDFRNLGYQYLKHHGGPYFECETCGLTIKQVTGVGRRQKYCDACAAKMKMQQSINSVMRMRERAADGL